MQSLIERYRYSSTSGQAQVEAGTCNQHQEMLTEIAMMKQEYNLQRIKLRFMYGESEILNMTLDELQAFEKYLEEWIYNIRSRKQMHMMEQEIQLLKNKVSQPTLQLKD
ncbi:hypothetical protein HPP92_009203 [Vanilla planifolia]|uniref:K-box domain-containing protein n=1 Tax=Vanilla planifolia TaxID=51239 RepID=A0A835V2M8_VANPL|nr:hypothetical protein HPP92_009203 [Vanilla planifolia]